MIYKNGKEKFTENDGFTLIEALMYLALLTLLIGGAGAASYSMIESAGRNQMKAMLQEEGDFLVAKINWALSSVASVEIPAVGLSGTSLSVTKLDGAIGTVLITLAGSDMTLKRGSNAPQVLNNTNVSVNNLYVTHLYGGGTNPESVQATFTLSTKTPNGMVLSGDFSATNYLRR